ncbi:tRNA (guanine-N7-)-methyltransferase [Peptoclostridium litorale DSM 5388]|uniref:tRNA (guanine-N(7)-)-methyltransferase n=1 Tax=Peptoclostridium litorale DSM 5388 TaxID=1121324 RepID=A0A069RIT0_PEPLI|nr:tRNA (guanosine(46)-N7)-methyltransferase TrmB [Peptoclostridium litorale]KDR96693.1 tRNA (guanine-N(7)-)-methyltransferase TrmB [Peptoclostridium litorale DSM 5388]SIN67670.1 tRNA (guanine-N7-)-methyltransferase [Peptoclostridium litorale DSM 5388]
MRLRKQRGAMEKLLSYSKYVVKEEDAANFSISDKFDSKGPVNIEIGTGRGKFITSFAKNNPGLNYVGIECKEEVLIKAVKKAEDMELQNIKFIIGDALRMNEYFSNGEVERIFINFCDPWPKRRHAKRRLVYRKFLDVYKEILIPGGEIHFKTDNEKLFEFALNEMSGSGLRLKNITFDLHASDYEGNITTEYEEKFAQKGMKIFRCEAHKID